MMTAVRNAYPTVCALVRSDVLRDAGGFADADHEEDWRPAVALAARGGVDLDPRPGRRYRVSDRSLYGAGADFGTVIANRRELRRALRRDLPHQERGDRGERRARRGPRAQRMREGAPASARACATDLICRDRTRCATACGPRWAGRAHAERCAR
jgi:hypothetical protein